MKLLVQTMGYRFWTIPIELSYEWDAFRISRCLQIAILKCYKTTTITTMGHHRKLVCEREVKEKELQTASDTQFMG